MSDPPARAASEASMAAVEADDREGWLAGEQEGIRIQQQADAAVGAAGGYTISKDAQKSSKQDINKAINSATKDIDTGTLKNLE